MVLLQKPTPSARLVLEVGVASALGLSPNELPSYNKIQYSQKEKMINEEITYDVAIKVEQITDPSVTRNVRTRLSRWTIYI
jgi:hypothetical protein